MKMGMQLYIVVIICSSLTVVLGLSLTCESNHPLEGSDLVCSCVTDQSINWFNGTTVSNIYTCTTAGACIPPQSAYSYSHSLDGSDSIYNMTILSFNFYSCGTYGCKNFADTSGLSLDIGITLELDTTTPPNAVEPTSGSDGTVTVTTSCISPSPAKDIETVKWYRVYDTSDTSVLSSTNIQSSRISCDTSCGFKQQTQYTYTQPTDNSTSEEVKLRVIILTKKKMELSWTSTNKYWIEKVSDLCECKCECTFDGGKIAFTVIDYVLDIVYTIVVFWLTFKYSAKVWKPEDVPIHAILVLSTLAVVLLDIGYTILLNLCENDDCKPECKEKCDCCTHTLRVVLTVVAWLLDFGGYGMILHYIFNRVVGGEGPKASTPDGRDQGHAMNDVTKNGGKVRPQPPPPQASSRPLPSIGGGGMGKRGLSANFKDNGDMTPMDGRGEQRLQPLKPTQATIAENDEIEKKKRKKKKKRKSEDNDGTERD